MVSSSSGHTIEHYKLIRQLGDGQFGAGYLAQDTSNNNKCCVKVFKNMDESTEKTFKAEIMAGQSGLNHENIIKLLGAGRSQICKNGKASKTDSYYIVSELCSNGEAFDFVQDAGGLKDHYARTMFKQLCSAVKFVHDKNIAHRDLKLENCFLDKNVVLKLADFGLAKFYAGASGSKLSTECGTP
jgi:serine/threonine protein kinase